mmetsp:Transcript_23736/g.42025  ORF Transcript_23736/g.42025 Transcript_23736/m.42025 type:complete len:317 (-) Transcript_23736:512-1462(-)
MEAEDIQVSGSRGAGNVVAEAAKLLERNRRVRLCAINFAMPRLVQAVEILKHKVAGLYQLNEIEHLEESNKTKLSVTLSFSQLDARNIGYQAPLPASQVQSVPLSEVAKLPEREERPPRPATSQPREEGRRPAPKRDRPAPDRTTDRTNDRTKREPQQEERKPFPARTRLSADSKYEIVQRRREEVKIELNEIRVTARRPSKYIVMDAVLLFKQQGHSSIILKASGTAIPRLVEVAERLRHCVAGLHQLSKLSRREVTDVFRAKDEEAAEIERTRAVPTLEVELSKNPLDTRHYGYQAPLPASKVKEMTLEEATSK